MTKNLLRSFLGLVIFAGILLALWPLGQTVYANWNQKQLRAQWQEGQQAGNGKQETGKIAQTAIQNPQSRIPNRKSNWPATRIVIPEADLDAVVLDGWDESTLKKAPGHMPGSALPGQAGNCNIAGHRNVYGSPFYKVDALLPGTPIELRTPQATYEYRVIEVKAVADADTTILQPPAGPDATPLLTLVTCTIPRTASRIVVSASLEPPAETSP